MLTNETNKDACRQRPWNHESCTSTKYEQSQNKMSHAISTKLLERVALSPGTPDVEEIGAWKLLAYIYMGRFSCYASWFG